MFKVNNKDTGMTPMALLTLSRQMSAGILVYWSFVRVRPHAINVCLNFFNEFTKVTCFFILQNMLFPAR